MISDGIQISGPQQMDFWKDNPDHKVPVFPDDFVDRIILGDCLVVMPMMPDHCVDMILCDLPYQVTARNSWDVIIPMEPLWVQYRRLLKPNGAIVLTAQGKFSAMLIMAATVRYQYSAVWCKHNHTNQLNAKKQLLRQHEDVLIFYDEQPTYNPQGLIKVDKKTRQGKTSTKCYNEQDRSPYMQEWSNWPTTLILAHEVDGTTSKTHPTEKPVSLFSYLIKTFSNPGDLILDNCSGAGTTAVSSRMLDRRFVCIENDPEMHAKSVERLSKVAIPTDVPADPLLALPSYGNGIFGSGE